MCGCAFISTCISFFLHVEEGHSSGVTCTRRPAMAPRRQRLGPLARTTPSQAVGAGRRQATSGATSQSQEQKLEPQLVCPGAGHVSTPPPCQYPIHFSVLCCCCAVAVHAHCSLLTASGCSVTQRYSPAFAAQVSSPKDSLHPPACFAARGHIARTMRPNLSIRYAPMPVSECLAPSPSLFSCARFLLSPPPLQAFLNPVVRPASPPPAPQVILHFFPCSSKLPKLLSVFISKVLSTLTLSVSLQ